ncbi:MAG TPA: helix-turn-helix domain-containing protein [Verrucomicrobiae bacterium]|nr:helix-turn-helix domain-containing protein [Verrucomicrobiae bacterium]
MDIWKQLTESDAVRRQQVAFACATGLPLTLLPATDGATAPVPSAFCVNGCVGPQGSKVCQCSLVTAEHNAARTSRANQFNCPIGLRKILMPVIISGRHVGSLLAGPFHVGPLNGSKRRRLMSQLKAGGLGSKANGAKASWDACSTITPDKLRAVETLLEMFAQYLAECGQRLLLHEAAQQSPLLQKIEAHMVAPSDQALSVRELAERLHISPCYFCKLFRKQTGLTFTEYRTQMRVETAKRLLLDPSRRVSEAAYEAGFDSIPYFNRAFRRHVGCSPSEFRERQARSIQAKDLSNRA